MTKQLSPARSSLPDARKAFQESTQDLHRDIETLSNRGAASPQEIIDLEHRLTYAAHMAARAIAEEAAGPGDFDRLLSVCEQALSPVERGIEKLKASVPRKPHA